MSAARHSHHAPVLMAAHRGGESVPAPKMSLYDLMGRFWQLDAERPFTPNETRLYFYWLNQFNAARWVASLPRRPLQVCADLGLTDKTLVVARIGLTSRGLMSYTEGHRRLSAVWSLGSEPGDSPEVSRNYSGLPTESAPKKAGIIPANKGGETGVSPQESRNYSGDIYKEEEKTLTTTRKDQDRAADAASAGSEDFEELTCLPASSDAASHTGGAATDVATSVRNSQGTDKTDRTDKGRTKPVGPRGWAYDPAAIAESLLLPFDSPEFRAAWVRYRTYREEMKFPRLTGGMQEQEVLRKLGVHAAGNEQLALDIISNAIEKGWQHLYKPDSNATTRQPSANRNRPAAGPGRVETLPPTNYGRNRGGAAPASPAA